MMQKSQSNKKFSGMSMVIGALLDLKKKAEEEAIAAIESGNKKEIEVLQSSMDEGKISALITVSNLLHFLIRMSHDTSILIAIISPIFEFKPLAEQRFSFKSS